MKIFSKANCPNHIRLSLAGAIAAGSEEGLTRRSKIPTRISSSGEVGSLGTNSVEKSASSQLPCTLSTEQASVSSWSNHAARRTRSSTAHRFCQNPQNCLKCIKSQADWCKCCPSIPAHDKLFRRSPGEVEVIKSMDKPIKVETDREDHTLARGRKSRISTVER